MFQENLKKIQVIIALFFLSLSSKLFFAYHYLEDWDSVQFAIALHRYSIIENLPHAPGYPLYILLGKLFNLIFQNDTRSLIYLSVFLGASCVIPLYLLTKKMFDPKVALLSCLFFIFLPVSWSLSEVALTNIPGQFFLILFVYFLYLAKSYRQILLCCVFGGLILGVRFTEFPIIAFLTLFKVLSNLKYRFIVLFSPIFFLLGLSLWLIPLIVISTPENFFKAYDNIARYIFQHDSVLGNPTIRSAFNHRISQFWFLSKIGFTKIFVITFIISFFFTFRKYYKNESFHLTIAWLFAYLVPLLFLYNLEVTRYLLPLAAPLSILVSLAITNISSKFRFSRELLLVLLLAILITSSADQLYRFNQNISPIESSIEYVKSRVNPEETTVVPTVTFRHFQYYAKEFSLVREDQLDSITIPQTKYYVIDYLPIKDRIKELANFEIIESREFKGDKDIFNRVSQVSIYILENKHVSQK